MHISNGTLSNAELDEAIKQYLESKYGMRHVAGIQFCHTKRAETYGHDEYEVTFWGDCAKRESAS